MPYLPSEHGHQRSIGRHLQCCHTYPSINNSLLGRGVLITYRRIPWYARLRCRSLTRRGFRQLRCTAKHGPLGLLRPIEAVWMKWRVVLSMDSEKILESPVCMPKKGSSCLLKCDLNGVLHKRRAFDPSSLFSFFFFCLTNMGCVGCNVGVKKLIFIQPYL